MKRVMKASLLTLAFIFLIFADASAETLIFQDDFSGALSTNWQTGTNSKLNPEGPQVGAASGMVAWTQGWDYIETKQAFSGNVRIEIDLGRDIGSSQCKDFVIELTQIPAYTGILRLQYGGQAVDSINVGQGPLTDSTSAGWKGICITDGGSYAAEMPTVTPHSGKAIFTVQNQNMTFGFTNYQGSSVQTPSINVGDVANTKIRIWASSSYRYVDAVRVYDLSGGCPADMVDVEVVGSNIILNVPSFCYQGQAYNAPVEVWLNSDGTWQMVIP